VERTTARALGEQISTDDRDCVLFYFNKKDDSCYSQMEKHRLGKLLKLYTVNDLATSKGVGYDTSTCRLVISKCWYLQLLVALV